MELNEGEPCESTEERAVPHMLVRTREPSAVIGTDDNDKIYLNDTWIFPQPNNADKMVVHLTHALTDN